MPRRAAATVRKIEPDALHRSRLVQQVINKVMLDGKKSIAEKIVYDALAIIGEKSGKDPLEQLERILARLLADDGERVVDDLLGDRLLAVQHHLVDDLLDQARAVEGVRLDLADGGCSATGHSLLPLDAVLRA